MLNCCSGANGNSSSADDSSRSAFESIGVGKRKFTRVADNWLVRAPVSALGRHRFDRRDVGVRPLCGRQQGGDKPAALLGQNNRAVHQNIAASSQAKAGHSSAAQRPSLPSRTLGRHELTDVKFLSTRPLRIRGFGSRGSRQNTARPTSVVCDIQRSHKSRPAAVDLIIDNFAAHSLFVRRRKLRSLDPNRRIPLSSRPA